jgi:hypothetical protein
MMAEGNRRTPGLFRDLLQKSLPRHPPRLFKPDLLRRRQRRNIDPFTQKRGLQLHAKGADKGEIITTLRTNGVIKVSGNEREL